MKKKLLFLIPVAGVIGLTLISNTAENTTVFHNLSITNSAGPLPAKTGAPGENNCTQCHNSFSVLAADNNTLASTLATSYQVGQTYSFAVGSTNNTNNGFQMTILDNNGNKAGSFVSGSANTAIQSSGGREYINHNAKTQSWTYNWVAPATDMGPLTAYYAINSTNNNGNNQGDEIYVGTISLPSDITNGLTNYEKQDKKVKMFFNQNSNELNLKYALTQKANVMVQVVSLSGEIVEEVKLGQKSFGLHNSKVKFNNIHAEGVYVVSLFVNNSIFTRKVYLK